MSANSRPPQSAKRSENEWRDTPDLESASFIASISHAWRALRYRNFKLFFFGQSISVIGTWMTKVATSWLVYHLTHSALLLGVVSFAGQVISFAIGPIAGVWVERLDRRSCWSGPRLPPPFSRLAWRR